MLLSHQARCLFILICIALTSVASSLSAAETKKQSEENKDTTPQLAQMHFSNGNSKGLASRTSLPNSVTKLLKKHKIPKENISVYIRDLNSSTSMLEYNADKLRTPASTMKLLTT